MKLRTTKIMYLLNTAAAFFIGLFDVIYLLLADNHMNVFKYNGIKV